MEVYLSTHNEVYDNIHDNVEGAVVTLNVLKNEGLISDNIIDPETDSIIDYENKYYVLSDAVLLSNEENSEEEGTELCDGMVEISVLKSWETLKDKVDTDDVIYICPKNGSGKISETTDSKELEERVSKLETILQRMNINDKNHVIFDVNSDTSKLAYFPDNAENNEYKDYNDIWRIVTNKNSSNEYTLMYNQPISTNYSSLFPKVSDIINYDSSTLKEYTKNVANSYSDCKNKKYISEKVYSINAAALGDYYSVDEDGDLGFIQNLYKVGDSYYKSLNSYDYSCSYLSTKIDDIDTYVLNGAEYSYLKKDSSYNSYYFSDNSYSLSLINEKNYLDYISIFDLRDNNPFKDNLYETINTNFKSYMKKTSNSYRYSLISSTNTLIQKNDNSFNSTYFRTLTKDEVNKNQSWLSSFSIPIGLYISDYYDISEISYINKIAKSYKYTPIPLYYVYSTYGEIVYQSTNIVRAYRSETICGNSSSIYLCGGTSYYLKNAKYNPIIDLKNVALLTNINNYSTNYKTKRPTCTNDDLGTYECPYLLKIGSYFSDGTTN